MTTPDPAGRRRDLRLDAFRGVAMLIILIAHVPGNPWTLWIPARFGFSDATEIFVFCSGLASALAFGGTFLSRGWLLGTARIAFRVWQVYWAHVGVFLVTVALLAAIDHHGWGRDGLRYLTRPFVLPFFEQTETALVGLMTLTYVPGLFDILPMYLVILAMVPVVMALHRAGGGAAVAAFVVVLWLAAAVAGVGWRAGARDGPLALLNLPGSPFADQTWFFNPFAWQLVFFTGFAFGMGWLRPPPVARRLQALAAAALLLSLPLAWHKLHGGHYLPPDWALTQALGEARDATIGLRSKTWQGPLRYLHFLAMAYLAWSLVGPAGRLLAEGFAAPAPGPRRGGRALGAAALALATAPYAHVRAIADWAPGLDAWLIAHVPLAHPALLGWLSLLHTGALAVLLWALTPLSARAWLLGPGWRGGVRVLRTVGSQSLAVFMTSIPLSQLCGLALDLGGGGLWRAAAVNLAGLAVLVVTAYLVTWIKGQPWRAPAAAARPTRAASRAPAE